MRAVAVSRRCFLLGGAALGVSRLTARMARRALWRRCASKASCKWDAQRMKFTNNSAANRYINGKHREDWSV